MSRALFGNCLSLNEHFKGFKIIERGDTKRRSQLSDAKLKCPDYMMMLELELVAEVAMMKTLPPLARPALCPLPRWAPLSSPGIYNQIKYSFVPTAPSISPSCWLPWLGVYQCVCVWWKSRLPSMELWQGPQTHTKAHVQKSSCFIVCGGTELLFCAVRSKAAGGWRSQRKMNTLVAGARLRGSTNPRLSIHVCAYTVFFSTQTVWFTHCVRNISTPSLKTIAHTLCVTLAWPAPQPRPGSGSCLMLSCGIVQSKQGD